MDGVGWGGMVLIWLSFLWPIVATVLVYALKATSSPISNRAAYWLCSVVGGYISAFLVGYVMSAVAISVSFSNELLFIALIVVSLLLSAAVPFGVALFMADKCS